MKQIKYIYLVILLLPLMVLSQTKGIIEIQNNSDLERNEAVVAIKWETILSHFPKIDTANFIVMNTATKKQIPWMTKMK